MSENLNPSPLSSIRDILSLMMSEPLCAFMEYEVEVEGIPYQTFSGMLSALLLEEVGKITELEKTGLKVAHYWTRDRLVVELRQPLGEDSNKRAGGIPRTQIKIVLYRDPHIMKMDMDEWSKRFDKNQEEN